MPVDTSVYERQRRTTEDQYVANQATNEYSRFLSQQRGQRQIGDYARQFSRSWPRFTAGWGQRGMAGGGVQSGAYQRAMQNYVGDYGRQRSQYMQDYADEQRGFDLAAARYQTERDRTLADIEAAKQMEIARAAVNIRELQPIIGG